MTHATPTSSSRASYTASARSRALRSVGLAGASLLLVGAVFAGCGKVPISSAHSPATKIGSIGSAQMMRASAPSSQVHLTIVAQKPGSSVSGPAYMPSTNFTLPAHSLVTITITNTDQGDTSLPATSPFGHVTGVVGGHAMLDGVPYTALSDDKVAHTFTLPSLGINVPIPGDAPAGQNGITVTFSFRTGAPGVYMWQCMDPCGADPNGWGGPMTMNGYMMGMVTGASPGWRRTREGASEQGPSATGGEGPGSTRRMLRGWRRAGSRRRSWSADSEGGLDLAPACGAGG